MTLFLLVTRRRLCSRHHHAFALALSHVLICSTRRSCAKDQTVLDMAHSSNACFQESVAPHIWQAGEVAMLRWCRISYVGIDSLANRHKNTRILFGTCVCQRDDQLLASSVQEVPSVPNNEFSRLSLVFCIIPYAHLTVKLPLFSLLQAQKSSTLLVHRGIFNMASASIGMNTERTNSAFQVDVVESMSSCTRLGGDNRCNWPWESCLGTQLCSQISVFSPVPILLMTLLHYVPPINDSPPNL